MGFLFTYNKLRFSLLRTTLTRSLLLATYLAGVSPIGHTEILTGPAPEISSDTWLNATPKKMSELQGKVVLVEFWTFGCWNCQNVEPYIKQWHARYHNKGLEVISVHAPEFERERRVDNVRSYIEQKAIKYAVVIDNDFSNWNRYHNRYWPTLYLIDKRGMLRHRKIGEGDYSGTERKIQDLLQETGP